MLKKYWDLIKNYFPIFGFVLVVLVFSVLTKGKILGLISLQSLLNQVLTTALVSIGAVFVFGSGNFDMSIGSCVTLSAVLSGYVALATGNLILALLAALGVSLFMGLLKGLFAAYVEVPLFIVTIVLGSMISAVVLVIMGKDASIYLDKADQAIPSFDFAGISVLNILALVLYFGLCLILFNYSALGKSIKILGGNPVTARQSGIDIKKTKIKAFLVSSIGVGLAAFMLLIRTRSVGNSTAGSLGTDIMIAIVLGGMPLMGGPRSKISAGLVGAASITVLNSGLTMLGLDLATIQISRAFIFLVVVYVASMSYRTKLLPR